MDSYVKGQSNPILGYPSERKMCEEEGIPRAQWRYYRDKFVNLPDEQILVLIKEKKEKHGDLLGFRYLQEFCDHYGISPSSWSRSVKKYPGIPTKERIEIILEGQRAAKKCNDNGKENMPPVKGGLYVFDMPKTYNRKTNY